MTAAQLSKFQRWSILVGASVLLSLAEHAIGKNLFTPPMIRIVPLKLFAHLWKRTAVFQLAVFINVMPNLVGDSHQLKCVKRPFKQRPIIEQAARLGHPIIADANQNEPICVR